MEAVTEYYDLGIIAFIREERELRVPSNGESLLGRVSLQLMLYLGFISFVFNDVFVIATAQG